MMDINHALAMMEHANDRAAKAEYELRKYKRAIARWSPVDGFIKTNPDNPETALLVVKLSIECQTEDAVELLEKLGCPSDKLDLAVI